MEPEFILISTALFIHTVALTVIVMVLIRHSKSLEESRTEDQRLRADLNKFSQGIRLTTPRARVSPVIKPNPKPEFDFSILDLDDSI